MGASVTENDHSDTNGSVFTWGQKYLSSILAQTTVEWKVLIGSFDYPTLLTLRQRVQRIGVHTYRQLTPIVAMGQFLQH